MQPKISIVKECKTSVPFSACLFQNTQVALLFTAPSIHMYVAHAGSPKSTVTLQSFVLKCEVMLHVLTDCMHGPALCDWRNTIHHHKCCFPSTCLWMCMPVDVCTYTKIKCKITSTLKEFIFICSCNSNHN